MSDTSQGEGWWQASDGKWYAPEQHPDVQPPTQPVEEAGPPTEATPPTTAAMPPVSPEPPTQAFPPPVGPPGAPPTQAFPPPGGPPTGPPSGSTGGSNKKWIIPAAVGAAVVIALVAFLLLRNDDDDDKVSTSTDNSDQSSDTTSSSKSSSKSSSSKSSSATSAEFVDPNGVEDRLLTASDIGSEFTDEAFTPATNTTDPCGNPNARAQVPPTLDVGSTAVEASSNLLFEEAVVFHKNAADNRKAFDIGVNSVTNCNEGTQTDASGSTSSFSITAPKDVSDDVGVTEAVEFTIQSGDTTALLVGVRLDNCVASFTFQFPTSGGESVQPDELGIVQDGINRLLG